MWTGLKSNAWIRLALVSGSIIIVDQVTKYILKINLALHDHIVILDNFFNITHVLNPGGAFGFFAEKSPEIRKFIFLFLSSLVALFVLWFYKKCAETYIFLSYGLALIFGGAIGTLSTGSCTARWWISLIFISGLLTGRPSILPTAPSASEWGS